MKLIAAFSLIAGASAFAPAARVAKSSSLLASPWSADESQFAYGLPGALPPFADGFDPLGFANGKTLSNMKQWREAETQHGRVAMLAAVGLLVTEEPIEYHPLFEAYNKDIGPAIRHLDEVRAVSPVFFEALGLLIGALELNRALVGWKAPGENARFQDLNDDYFPGDVNFDPLGLKPADAEGFLQMSNKELQNGRLAMLGVAGMVAQELVNGKEIFVNLGLAEDRFDPSSVPIQF